MPDFLPPYQSPNFQALFEALPGLYLILTPDLQIVAVSDAYLNATMTKREDILGRQLFDVFPDNPEDRSATGERNLKNSLNNVLQYKKPDTMAVQKYDIRQPESEGGRFEERYWSPVNSPVLDRNNNVAYIIHRVEDVTDFVRLKQQDTAHDEELMIRAAQMEMEIYLRAQEVQEANRQLATAKAKVDDYARLLEGKVHTSEEKYRLLMQHAKDGIFILDAESIIVDANEAAEKLIESELSSIIGHKFDTLIGTESMPSSFLDFNNLLQKDSSHVENLYLKRSKGGKIYVDISLSRIELDNAQLVLCVARDVTERVKLEHTLRQAQKMEAVGQLTGGIAHDFNNILGVIIGNLDLMKSEMTPKGEGFRILADKAASQGAEFIRALLAFARQQPLNPSIIDANEHLARMADFLKHVLGKQIEIELKNEPGTWLIQVDPIQLETAITNLAINARDAMAKGGKLLITAQNAVLDEQYVLQNPEAIAGDYTMINVADTGSGMSPETAAHVFEPFFTTKEKGKGTGLGLSMVYGFIKQSGGHIKIYSELGCGTTVKLYFPRCASKEEKAQVEKKASTIPGGCEVILVVEDNVDMRSVVIKQLQGLGYRTIEAANGMQALAAINSGIRFDLLFSDVIMPGGLTGFDLVRQLRAKKPDLPILLTSGFPGPILASQEGCLIHNQVELLSKPYRKDELAHKLREMLNLRMSA